MAQQTHGIIKELLRTIQEISRELNSCCAFSDEDQRATYLQFQALDLLQQQPLALVGAIATALHISKSSATQLVERLVSAGLVTKLPDTIDKRAVRLRLTTAGLKERDHLAKKLYTHCSVLFTGLDSSDLHSLIKIHNKILTHLRQSSQV